MSPQTLDTRKSAGPKSNDQSDRGDNTTRPSTLRLDALHSTKSSSAPPESYRRKLRELLGVDYDGAEKYRLALDTNGAQNWKTWGPYMSERQWATVREDYSADGNAWAHFPHEHARSRAYRWGEDGIGGISDDQGRLCLSMAFWNGKDPILKERLYGLANHEGNHGEDVKEVYWYLDATPTHSYMRQLYKYPQGEFPYEEIAMENGERDRDVPEFELMDTDAFKENRYWDIFMEYAKDEDDPEAISVRITAYNRGPDAADIHLIPQLFFSNYWSWPLPTPEKPILQATDEYTINVSHPSMGQTHLYCPPAPGKTDEEVVEPELLFAENETNMTRLWDIPNSTSYPKDAFHDHIIPSHRPEQATSSDGEEIMEDVPAASPTFVNPNQCGTKSAAHYFFEGVPSGECVVVRIKLTAKSPAEDPAVDDDELFDHNMDERRAECDEFYSRINGRAVSADLQNISRQALSGMLWSKQYYRFDQQHWIEGDPAQPAPPPERRNIRNKEWTHMNAAEILSMPDKWEYPFFAAWDSAFHCIPLAIVDPAFAKSQLQIFVREWYMKPDGQIPAYEWNFGDVNPPVHAWATYRVFKIERQLHGREDIPFLESIFHKLLLNFTWWVTRKDEGGKNIFEGGFLGLDNIGAFNRSEPAPTGGVLRQADGTAWMAFYCLNMLSIALELAKHSKVYEDMASKFFEHFIAISDAMTYKHGDEDINLWNEEDGLYYDAIDFGGGNSWQLPIRSLVSMIPLYATLVLEPSVINQLPNFKERMESFIEAHPGLSERNIANIKVPGKGERTLLSLVNKERLVSILEKMLDEDEFLSDHGIRSLSKRHKAEPWGMEVNGERHEVGYWPGDSHSPMFGGNSNWRGPIWLAVNFLLIESLQRLAQYYGDDLQVECPTNSGIFMPLLDVSEEIQHRIISIFSRDETGRRPTNGGNDVLNYDPHFRDHVHFFEFFHGDDGHGLGASHQTGWTGLVAWHILQTGLTYHLPMTPRTPLSLAKHYFQEINGSHEGDMDGLDETDEAAYSTRDLQSSLSQISPDDPALL